MISTLGFDVYGTLIDTAGVTTALQQYAGDRAGVFSSMWRDKQLEYSFRLRALKPGDDPAELARTTR